jgi:hypothetical protein
MRIYISGKLSAFQAEDKSSILFIRLINGVCSSIGRTYCS